jgi:hypothetical protein
LRGVLELGGTAGRETRIGTRAARVHSRSTCPDFVPIPSAQTPGRLPAAAPRAAHVVRGEQPYTDERKTTFTSSTRPVPQRVLWRTAP